MWMDMIRKVKQRLNMLNVFLILANPPVTTLHQIPLSLKVKSLCLLFYQPGVKIIKY